MWPSRVLRGKNLYQVLSLLPNNGIGSKVKRSTWQDNSYWEITRLRLALDGRHGDAWGSLTWRGTPSERVAKVNGGLKQVWEVLDGGSGKGGEPEWKVVVTPELVAGSSSGSGSGSGNEEAQASSSDAEGSGGAAT